MYLINKTRLLLVFFFFFQAEDGIRDVAVTGVQTCALPILLKPYLESLAWQELPPRVKLHYVFVDDGCDRAARSLLEEFVALRGGEILRRLPGAVGDFSDEHPATHQWSLSAMRRVGANKDRILRP